MNYLIRKARINDLVAVVSAHRRSILEICSKDYTPDQIEKWANVVYSEDVWKQIVQHELHYVIELDGTIEGFCHSKVHENNLGEIKGLYFTRALAGKGIGREVFERSIEYLVKNNCNRVIIFGTKTAHGFYQKMGFKTIEALTINVRGADLECFKMEKKLTNLS